MPASSLVFVTTSSDDDCFDTIAYEYEGPATDLDGRVISMLSEEGS